MFVCLLLIVIYLFKQAEVLAAIQLMWTCYTHPPTHILTEDSHNTGNLIPQGTNEHGSYL